MKKQLTILSILISVLFSYSVLAEQVHADTNVGGIINTNTTWTTSNSPYIVTDTIQIPLGVTLTIEPGVIINKPTDGDMFLIAGTIYAHGAVDNKITFDGGDNSDFFHITGSGSAFLDLKYCIVENGLMFWPGGNHNGHFSLQYSELTNLAGQSTIWFSSDDINISYNKFINTYGFRIYVDNNIRVHIQNNFFYKGHSLNDTGYWNFYILVDSQDLSEVVIKYNSFIDMSDIVLKLLTNSANTNNANTFSASENYWNTQDISVINSMIHDKNDDISVENYINYLPILTEPHPDTPIFTTCTLWTYSNWSECIDGEQTRIIISSSPENCIDGNPNLSQSCQFETDNENDTENTTQPEQEINESNLVSLIPEGSIIKTIDNPDVYIVKYVGNKKFKRLILSPSVFNNYGHLKWENIVDVSQLTLNFFTTSELVRTVGDDKIYKLYPQGDSGQKKLIKNNSVLTRLGFDSDAIYEINEFDRKSYLTGDDLE